MQLRYRSARNKVPGSIQWPTIRIQIKSNRAKRSLASIITTPATCPEKLRIVQNSCFEQRANVDRIKSRGKQPHSRDD